MNDPAIATVGFTTTERTMVPLDEILHLVAHHERQAQVRGHATVAHRELRRDLALIHDLAGADPEAPVGADEATQRQVTEAVAHRHALREDLRQKRLAGEQALAQLPVV